MNEGIWLGFASQNCDRRSLRTSQNWIKTLVLHHKLVTIANEDFIRGFHVDIGHHSNKNYRSACMVKTWILMMTFGDVHPIPTGGLIIKKREKTCTFHQTKPIWIAGTIPFTYAFVFFSDGCFPIFLGSKFQITCNPPLFWRRGFTFFDGCHVPSSYTANLPLKFKWPNKV